MKKLLGTDTKGSAFLTPGAANAGTVTFRGIELSLQNILVITNVTRNTIIYNFASPTTGAVSFTNNVLTLDIDTSTHESTDVLQIFVDLNDLTDKTHNLHVALEEDNDVTQEAILGMYKLLRSVWQMGSAAGAPSFTIRNATAADLNATVSGTVSITANSAVNMAQVGGTSTLAPLGNASPEVNSGARSLAVAHVQTYHMPVRPQNIYGNIIV